MASAAAIMVDGNLGDWTVQDRIDRGLDDGYAIYAKSDGNAFAFALKVPGTVGTNTTVWLNTDRNVQTGYQIFGFAGGAEYSVNFDADGKVSLYSGAPGASPAIATLAAVWSDDRSTVEFRVDKAAIGNPQAIDTLYDVNDAVFLPGSYSAPAFTVFNDMDYAADPAHRIAIVWSESTANAYFSKTAYSQLFMATQAQAMQAGVPFDILTEDDLTSLATVAKYDTIVFPSFRNVDATKVTAIAQTLEQATKQYGIGLVAAGEFMTNDAAGNALAGDSYARMKLLFDATRVTGGFPADVTVKATDAAGLVFDGYADGQVVHDYKNVGWNAFTSVSGTGQTIATSTINGQTYAAAIATQTGGRNVIFSSEAVMADENLLQKAIDYSVHGGGLSVGLQMTRNTGLFASRVDMDQSQEKGEVKIEEGAPGIYDKMLPILAEWKAKYNFVGSYYVNIGNDPAAGQATDWAVSLPYYKQLIDMGNEIGTHSYTHPHDTNILTDEQIKFEFGQSRAELEQQLSNYLGRTVTVAGAAVPGAPEQIATSQEILKYVQYLSGGYSGVGAGYPNAIGYMNPANAATNQVYIAPNTSFDFSLMEFQKKTVAEAEAIWAKELATLTGNADAPVVVWPWHDYGPTEWAIDNDGVPSGTGSPYARSMFDNFVAAAAAKGLEFVTLADLANRVNAFDKAQIVSSVTGNTIKATVASSMGTGLFALDVDGQKTGQVIQSVKGWYAYSDDKVFLPTKGGSFEIAMGDKADDVTHITALPMRASLETLSGDGRDLSFTVAGEGKVVIDIKAPGTNWLAVEGGKLESLVGEIATIDIGAIGTHAVKVTQVANAGPTITSAGGGDWGSMTMNENATLVGTVTATDPNIAQGDRVRYSIGAGGEGSLFTIDANTGVLKFIAAPDYETARDSNRDNIYDVNIVATDARGVSDSQLMWVYVKNVTEQTGGPTITSFGGKEAAWTSAVAENTSAVATVTATDPDLRDGDTVRFSIEAVREGHLFQIDPVTGVLSFKNAPDFENPQDSDRNNIYDVSVIATDSFGVVDKQMLYVTVSNVKEQTGGPTITSSGGGDRGTMSMLENSTSVGTVNATDPDTRDGDFIRYSIAQGGEGSLFNIDPVTGALTFKSAPDFENAQDSNRDNIYDVTVVATDSYGRADSQLLWVYVKDVAGLNQTGSIWNDTMNGTGEGDTLDGSWGNDTLNGFAGHDRLIGSYGNDTLNGGDGNDTLDGGNGTDVLDGGNGDDLLIGGDDRDVMTGGAGRDVFRFEKTGDTATHSSLRDIITDFRPGEDKIDLSAIDANASLFAWGDQAFTLIGENGRFTGAGQLRYRYEMSGGKEYTVVEGTTLGSFASFSIALTGHHVLNTGDFFL
ncbi:cadherin domain-containing protein [Sphingomonas sp. Leaf10]|uniref:cadherin domain-containing protein n=1 Tax=Sphingomonas sp. Leaf10 TaxID=1735676 RepID=UPI0006F23599|nr:cadherin domain-containing protein [Sphingomonas sp. Leaf10]KQM30888.1 cadherin [Sphingomonas sp. Leaf10]